MLVYGKTPDRQQKMRSLFQEQVSSIETGIKDLDKEEMRFLLQKEMRSLFGIETEINDLEKVMPMSQTAEQRSNLRSQKYLLYNELSFVRTQQKHGVQPLQRKSIQRRHIHTVYADNLQWWKLFEEEVLAIETRVNGLDEPPKEMPTSRSQKSKLLIKYLHVVRKKWVESIVKVIDNLRMHHHDQLRKLTQLGYNQQLNIKDLLNIDDLLDRMQEKLKYVRNDDGYGRYSFFTSRRWFKRPPFVKEGEKEQLQMLLVHIPQQLITIQKKVPGLKVW
jgi:hypothetical protein